MNEETVVIKQESFKDHPLLSRLLELHDIPKELYIKGKLPEVTIDEYGRATPRILTIVGSRKYTNYGRNAVAQLVSSLNGEDVVIISGMAHGIDGIAHETALKNNLTTLAVLGNGLDEKVIYPRSHLGLAKEIINSGGALISELPPDTQAAQWTFPARNRIVAALADAVLIAEAGEKSGTLITARQALELGRDIGAIPGDIFSPTTVGTHGLIREGAYIVSSADDLFALLHLTKKEATTQPADNHSYTEQEQMIMDALNESMEKDLLLLKSQLSLIEFLTALSSLELQGHIEETFGEVRRLV
jgi:DNA processing protein